MVCCDQVKGYPIDDLHVPKPVLPRISLDFSKSRTSLHENEAAAEVPPEHQPLQDRSWDLPLEHEQVLLAPENMSQKSFKPPSSAGNMADTVKKRSLSLSLFA